MAAAPSIPPRPSANGACYDGDVWDLFDGKGRNTEVLPLGTVVTIPAAGSEMSNSSVITREEDLCKRGRNTPLNFPKFSILNPEFTYTLPPFQTACGVVDIMAHMMERYFTRVTHVELIDRMTEGALKTVVGNAPIVMHEPENYDARAEIMWAGCLAHNTLLQTGRIGDWGQPQAGARAQRALRYRPRRGAGHRVPGVDEVRTGPRRRGQAGAVRPCGCSMCRSAAMMPRTPPRASAGWKRSIAAWV